MRTQGIIPIGWAVPAGKDITTAFKGVAEIIARMAEPLMRYATIYLALATALPALRWEPLYNIAMVAVIASPEFVLIGALSIAEVGYKEGRKGWAIVLFMVCGLLTIIMTATFMEVFHIMAFGDYAHHVLNFSRCLVAVGFSVVLNKLDGGVSQDLSQNQPAQVPDFNKMLEDQKAEILSHLEQTLITFQTQIVAQIQPKIDHVQAQIQPVDYNQIADKMMPIISQVQATLQEEIEGKIAGIPAFDDAGFRTSLLQEITALIADHSHGIDLTELASRLAPMMSVSEQQTMLSTEQLSNDLVNKKPRVTAKLTEQSTEQSPNETTRIADGLTERSTEQNTTVSANKTVRTQRTIESSETAKKIRRLLRKDPTLGPTELADRCDCSKSYASSVKSSFLKSKDYRKVFEKNEPNGLMKHS
jgi:hypothetical protein